MMHRIRHRRLLTVLIAFAVVLAFSACAPKARPPIGQLDTPEHHTYTGIKLLNQGKYTDAQREFELALQLNAKFSSAHTGMGLVKAQQGDLKAGFEAMKSAKKYANTNEEKTALYAGLIRLHTMNAAREKKWLDDAKDAFDDAILVDPKADAPYFFMGKAYKQALEFAPAGQMFAKVLELKGEYAGPADAEWKPVQKIQRAMPGTITGKKIAVVERITRADAAALFMEELKIDGLYGKRTLKSFDTSFKDPAKAKEAAAKGPKTAADIADHPLKADIEGLLAIGVRGLEPYPDGSFRPNEIVDRASFAMMVEDILIKATGDNALATKFIGNTSPFPDLRADLAYFNAVMVVTSRGLMEVKDAGTGEFAPLNPVPGVDGLLVIRKMKEQLKF
ncbi:MAG: hypothetical protein A4E73_03521 [Syntrophaceae bacterium PtaU1.Bin231]|nr:MAG: hypothetical protein A4E73_03521 [Syntrophaceae bacterium PtaU1.Bin231]